MQTKSNPDFIVIAGPNGAGKSTTSKKLLEPFGITAFDWDQRFYARWGQFEFDPLVTEGVKETINSEFHKHVEFAFSKNAPVAYETNFHSTFNFDLAKKAKDNGYKTSLYFLALKDAELGIERVAKRVLDGGHYVNNETIRERYRIGLEMLDSKAINHYDQIAIYNSADKFILQLVIDERKIVYKATNLDVTIINQLPSIKSILG